jgi:DNA-binding MarR family transcriptional regulator
MTTSDDPAPPRPDGRLDRALPDFHQAPGHLFRRARQFHDALWLTHVSSSLTPLQYAVLTALELDPGIDQRTLGERIAQDKSTVADLAARLANRGYVVRSTDRSDRRRIVLTLTRRGRSTLYEAAPRVAEIGQEMLSTLSADEGRELIRLLDKLVYSRQALEASGRTPPDELTSA